jgi:hypothetical protein
MKTSLYETDFYQWTIEQSQLLALGKLDGLDLVNLVEEIESLGKQQQQELRNRVDDQDLPQTCPYTVEQIFDTSFPEGILNI